MTTKNGMTPKEILIIEMNEVAIDILNWANYILTQDSKRLTREWVEEVLDHDGETFSALHSVFTNYLHIISEREDSEQDK